MVFYINRFFSQTAQIEINFMKTMEPPLKRRKLSSTYKDSYMDSHHPQQTRRGEFGFKSGILNIHLTQFIFVYNHFKLPHTIKKLMKMLTLNI